jgi:dihydroorotate dehydrogenase electron transfer subunit
MKNGEIISNDLMGHGYYRIKFHVPEIAAKAQAGQFVHVQIATLRDRILRRPFSISNVSEAGALTVIYKVVGDGTKVLSQLPEGMVCDLMGPLGNPYSLPQEDEIPVIVAGGYGSAATYLLARRAPQPGVLLLGAKTGQDLILTEEFAATGFEVRCATEDGSRGTKGYVTALLDDIFEQYKDKKLRFYACGPTPMLLALGRILEKRGYNDGELSLDHLMCCGVGACFACVVRVKADNEDGWRYARTCKEGPVFRADAVWYGE